MPEPSITCPICGKANPIGAKFCFACGKALPADTPNYPPAPASNFITLTCPQCGGRLQVATNADQAQCTNCGTQHLVQRGGGVLALMPLVHAAQQVRQQSEAVRDVTGQILQDVAGAHKTIWQQADTYEESTRKTAINQEILTIRKELNDLKPRYKVLSSKSSWWLLPMTAGFGIWLFVNPPDESIRGFLYFMLGLLVLTFLVVAIIVPASSTGMKKRIDELEARLKYLEQSRF